MVVEFLKYWWNNFSIGWHFGYGVFGLIAGICFLVSTGLFCYKKRYQYKWKQWEQIIMKTAFYLFVISFFVATFFVAPFLQSRDNKVIPINTKQDIRTFLESLKPEILAKVDARVKEVGVWLGPVNQVKLTSLSDRLEFSKFLSFKQTEQVWLVTGEGKQGDFIRPAGETGTLIGYYLYPKDALIK